MKTIGILGGLGPKTTAEFYLDIIDTAQLKNLKQRPYILISNVPVTIEIERNSILYNKDVEKNLPYLIDEARRLENAGADFLVMPCNSLHIYIEDLRSSVNIPFLSIIDESVKYIQQQGILSIGIISTAITVKNKLYENAFQANNIKSFTPTPQEQKLLDNIILNLVSDTDNPLDYDNLINVIKNFQSQSIDNIILGCTDLQLLNPKYPSVKIYDSMRLLAEASVDYMIG